MKTLALFSLSLAVALGMPAFPPGVEQSPVLTEREQRPLVGDSVPVQGHVVVNDPAPQVRPGSGEQKEELLLVPVDMKQSMVEQEMKVKPQVREEQEGEVKTEIKKEPDVKAEPDAKEDLKADVESEVNLNPEVKAEVNTDVEPEVNLNPEVKAEVNTDMEPEVNLNPEVKAEVNTDVEPEVNLNPEVKAEVNADVEPEVNLNPEVKAEVNTDVEPEVNLNPEVKSEVNADVEPEVEMEPELNDDPAFKVKSEVKVEPDVQEQFQVQMNLEAETETGQEIKERHIDMEGKDEMVGEPIMELEPLDDDDMELSEVEKSLRATFQNQNPVNHPLLEEGVLLMSKMDYVSEGEPIMELEPLDDDKMVEEKLSNTELSDMERSMRATFQNQNPVNHPLTEEEEEEGLMRESDNVLDEEPIMELEPLDDDNMERSEVEKSLRATFQNQNPVNHPLLEEGGLLMSKMDYVSEGEPIMELEPLDDDKMVEEKLRNTELSDMERSMRATFQNQNPVNHPLTEGEEEEGLMRESDNVLDEEPIMELEPLDDDNMFEEKLSNTELSDVEKSMRATFQNQNPVNHPLPEEGVLLMSKMDYVSEGEPIMELEPEEEQSFLHQQVMSEAAIMEEGPALDIMGQQIPSLSEYFPNEEARMGMEYGKHQDYLPDYLMTEESGREFVREEKQSSMGLREMEDGPDGGAQIGVAHKREKKALIMRQGVKNPEETRSSPSQDKQERSHCAGVALEGKCYQFFKGPKGAAEAEFFCQDHFPGGHLASITSQHIHREVMNMMLLKNGALTRSWIGGLRYLKTGRFIWLDGSHWSYADWLSGEPNNTIDVEDCLEVLPRGNGKFNDFTCWEPQAFICSYSYY